MVNYFFFHDYKYIALVEYLYFVIKIYKSTLYFKVIDKKIFFAIRDVFYHISGDFFSPG